MQRGNLVVKRFAALIEPTTTVAKQALQQLDESGTTSALPTPSIAEATEQGLARQDGNTVNVEKEMIDLAQNQSRFDFAAQMTAKRLRMIRMAGTGKSM